MKNELAEEIKENPDYQKLIAIRTAYTIKLSVAMLMVYFVFILTIAFNPSYLAVPFSDGSVVSIGIPIGIAIIIFAFILTGLYTKRANTEFDDLAKAVKKSVGED